MASKTTIRLTLTQEEAMALFIECQCCAIGKHAEPYQTATNKIHNKLKAIGAFDNG